MSSSTHFSFASGTVPYSPVKPRWLRPVVTAIVIAVHAVVAWVMVVTSVQLFHAIDVTLVPSGDPLGLEEQEADDQPPPEEVELPDLAMPAPMILSPDAPVKEEIVKPKTHVVEKRTAVERANTERRAPGRRALGLPSNNSD
jgi:periplasmic protein TonB